MVEVINTSVRVQSILVAGKPHLGTDRLIRILQAFRKHLTALGVKIHFGTCAMGLHVQHDRVVGITLKGAQTLACVSCAAHLHQGIVEQTWVAQ